MGDTPEVDAAAPTELAGIADADTRPERAWGLAEDHFDEVRPRRFTPAQITAAAVAASLVATACAGTIAYTKLRDSPPEPAPVAVEPTTSEVPVVAPAPPVAAPDVPRLRDGVYRIDYDWPNSKHREEDDFWSSLTNTPPSSIVMALATHCTPADCVVTLTRMTEALTVMTDLRGSQMRFAGGAWRESAGTEMVTYPCRDPDGSLHGANQVSAVGQVYPSARSVYQGNLTQFVEESTCGNEWRNVETPITLTRIGELPPSLGGP
jgi:hypothetical protein